MCNFADCWTCEPYEAEIIIDYDNNIYEITIELNSGDPEELIAINSQEALHVDVDIVKSSLVTSWLTVTVPAGVYPFKSSVGTNGGYVIALTMN